MLELDNIDEHFFAATERRATDLLFISKHASASGAPALTVHPIGNPGRARADMGGFPGKCPPPSPRLAPMYRRLASVVARSPLQGDFQVSLEGTHHGPWVTSPSMFAEIGSQEAQWLRSDAADLWADVLFHELGLDGGSGPTDAVVRSAGSWWDAPAKGGGVRESAGGDGPRAHEEESGHIALVCIGGGHYAPKHGDVVRGAPPHVFLGHILPSYTMDLTGDAKEWQDCVRDAVEATRKGFAPEAPEIVCHVDKKAFKGPHRDALVQFIEQELGLRVAFKASQLASQATPTPLGARAP